MPRLAEINLGCSRGIKNVKRLHTDQWLEKFIWAHVSYESNYDTTSDQTKIYTSGKVNSVSAWL